MDEITVVYSDLDVDEGDPLIDKIILSSPDNNEILNKHLPDAENELKTSTYFSIGKNIIDYIDIPVYDKKKRNALQYFQVLQEWEGCVVLVDKDKFTAMLIDITADEDIANEEADFEINDVNDEDRHFIKEGSIFRWVVGYHRDPNGSKRRASEIVFRRIPWTSADIKKADKKTEKFKNIIWE